MTSLHQISGMGFGRSGVSAERGPFTTWMRGRASRSEPGIFLSRICGDNVRSNEFLLGL